MSALERRGGPRQLASVPSTQEAQDDATTSADRGGRGPAGREPDARRRHQLPGPGHRRLRPAGPVAPPQAGSGRCPRGRAGPCRPARASDGSPRTRTGVREGGVPPPDGAQRCQEIHARARTGRVKPGTEVERAARGSGPTSCRPGAGPVRSAPLGHALGGDEALQPAKLPPADPCASRDGPDGAWSGCGAWAQSVGHGRGAGLVAGAARAVRSILVARASGQVERLVVSRLRGKGAGTGPTRSGARVRDL